MLPIGTPPPSALALQHIKDNQLGELGQGEGQPNLVNTSGSTSKFS